MRHCATSRKVAGSILDGVTDTNLPALLWPGVDSASNRNEYQEYFLGGKAAVRGTDNLTMFMSQLS